VVRSIFSAITLARAPSTSKRFLCNPNEGAQLWR
jgi:hypothetical protein